MSRKKAPKGSSRSPSDSGSGKKPTSSGQEKAKFKTDTKKRIEEAIAVLDFRLHMEYLNTVSALGGGDFEEFKRSWLMNYYNAMTAAGFRDKPKNAPSLEEQPRLTKANDELMFNLQPSADNSSNRGNTPKPK